MPKAKILFLCTRNSARSQMAEAFLKKYAGDHFEVHSAGLEPTEINPYAIRVMEEIGFDMSDHHAKGAEIYLGKVNFAYLITVCPYAEKNCPSAFLAINERLHWPFEDPSAFEGSDEAKLQKFREVRDQVDAKLKQWLAELGIPAKTDA